MYIHQQTGGVSSGRKPSKFGSAQSFMVRMEEILHLGFRFRDPLRLPQVFIIWGWGFSNRGKGLFTSVSMENRDSCVFHIFHTYPKITTFMGMGTDFLPIFR